MAVDLGRVSLGDHEAMAGQQVVEAALKRPEREIQAGCAAPAPADPASR